MMTEEQTSAALERLKRGIQDSRRQAQLQAMELAQGYFDDSVEELKQRVNENRAVLKNLPDQVPGGHEESFQVLFQELMDSYTQIDQCLEEARENVSELDKDQLRRQGEVDATDAARREARELGVDLTTIEGTGSEGRIIVDDVRNAAEAAEADAAQQTQEAAGQAQQAAGQAQQIADDAARQAQDFAGQATGQVGDALGGVTDQADQAQEAVGGTPGGVDEDQIDASDAARREAAARGIDLSQVKGTGAGGRIVYWDVAEADEEPEEAATPAGQVVDQAASQADGAVGKVGGVADQLSEQAVSTAQQTADQAAQGAQSKGAQEGAEEPRATKAARRKAEEMGVDLSRVQGTGSGGLITIRDVMES
jgi:pyruvate/2-oxoglutarate dehydrogenase complex dihydrolipoamide acyltransferase (E2) component